jgi:hypothetical protein
LCRNVKHCQKARTTDKPRKNKIYQTINQFKKGYQHKFNAIRNKKGELAMNKKRESRNMERTF